MIRSTTSVGIAGLDPLITDMSVARTVSRAEAKAVFVFFWKAPRGGGEFDAGDDGLNDDGERYRIITQSLPNART